MQEDGSDYQGEGDIDSDLDMFEDEEDEVALHSEDIL